MIRIERIMIMIHKLIPPIIFIMVMFAAVTSTIAQTSDDSSSLLPKQNQREEPSSLREVMEKMRIEKEKKDFAEMIKRGKDALALSESLQRSVDARTTFDRKDIETVESVEKLVKKVRSDLGGGDDSDRDDVKSPEKEPSSFASGCRSLLSASQKLVEELKKTSRFTISAAAIQSSNAVLRLTRWLKVVK